MMKFPHSDQRLCCIHEH